MEPFFLVGLCWEKGLDQCSWLTAAPKYTSTDADGIFLSRKGVATVVLSVPNRYMHSPNEMVDTRDLQAAASLIAHFCRDLKAGEDFVHR